MPRDPGPPWDLGCPPRSVPPRAFRGGPGQALARQPPSPTSFAGRTCGPGTRRSRRGVARQSSSGYRGALGHRRDPGRNRLFERPIDPPLEPHARQRDEFEPGGFARAVHLIEDDKRLPPNGSPRLERPAAEFPLAPTHGTLGRETHIVRLESFPRLAFDPHLRMAAAKGHRVPAKFDRRVVRVFEHVIGAERIVLSRRRDEHEVTAVAEMLHVGEAALLPPCALEFRDRKPVARDELGIDGARIFAGGDASLEEVAIAPREVAHGKLLDESFKRCGLCPIFHVGPYWGFAKWASAGKTKPQIAILAIKTPGKT